MTDTAVNDETITNHKSMSLIVTKGTLDWGYPPFILATTAAAMGLQVNMFFTFYGLNLLHKKLDLGISTLGNPGMKMPMMGMHMGMPNMMGMIPGVDGMATGMMKNLIDKKGVASIEDLREAAVESSRGLNWAARRPILKPRPNRTSICSFERADRQPRLGDRISMATQTLDTKGMNCPLPILKAKKALGGLATGDTLEVLATDPGSVKDFEAFCRQTGNELLESNEDSGIFSFLIKNSA